MGLLAGQYSQLNPLMFLAGYAELWAAFNLLIVGTAYAHNIVLPTQITLYRRAANRFGFL
jgi:predicted metal-binding membrane protein